MRRRDVQSGSVAQSGTTSPRPAASKQPKRDEHVRDARGLLLALSEALYSDNRFVLSMVHQAIRAVLDNKLGRKHISLMRELT